jgi:hypothetical protein
MIIANPGFFSILHPDKGTGSRIRIRNTAAVFFNV